MRNSTGSSCLFSFLGGISFNLVEEEQQKGVVHGQESMRAIIACEATKQFHKNNQALFFQLGKLTIMILQIMLSWLGVCDYKGLRESRDHSTSSIVNRLTPTIRSPAIRHTPWTTVVPSTSFLLAVCQSRPCQACSPTSSLLRQPQYQSYPRARGRRNVKQMGVSKATRASQSYIGVPGKNDKKCGG